MVLVKQHILPPGMEMILMYLTGILWILTYIVIIYKGFKDKRCGMPFIALCGNITWEFIYTFVFPFPQPAKIIIFLWFALDVIILIQFILYSREDLPKPLSTRLFLPTLTITLLIAFALHYFIAIEFQNLDGGYSAYGLNFMMSAMFVGMLLRRDDLRGQSMYIAVFKLVGTLCASILSYSYFPDSVLLTFLYLVTFFYDALYVILLRSRIKIKG